MGLNNSNHSELSCDNDFCYFSMWKELSDNTIYHLGKNHKIPKNNCTLFSEPELVGDEEIQEEIICLNYHTFTDIELELLMKEKIIEKLEYYAEVFKEREIKQNNIRTNRIGSGIIIINAR